jgi:hypothetical protein
MQMENTPIPSQTNNAKSPTIWKRCMTGAFAWAKHHKGEVLWAATFALVIAWLISPPSPRPYSIYIVADAHTDKETMSVFEQLKQNSSSDALSIGDVPVQVKVEKLGDREPLTAIAKAKELIKLPDTLLVIEHMRSTLIEESLPTYFQANPPVPVLSTTASGEDLLFKCREAGDSCLRDGWFAPLLQLSPTNQEQGLAAIRFAAQNHKRRFLIITEFAPEKDEYTKRLISSYEDAIQAQNSQNGGGNGALMIVDKIKLSHLPDKAKLNKLAPDCVLYAGELGTARGLLNLISDPRIMLILSDSALETRETDSALAEFKPARFTYQTDASDYNYHTNIYGRDAYWIARQLIGDVNTRGGDWWYSIKSALHFHSVKDARRNLVRIIKENSSRRTWYSGFPPEAGGGTGLGATYVFSHERRVDGMFHVWQLSKNPELGGREMEDIDNWHPPKQVEEDTHSSNLAKPLKNLKK